MRAGPGCRQLHGPRPGTGCPWALGRRDHSSISHAGRLHWTSTDCAGTASCDACSAGAKQLSVRDRSALSEVVPSRRPMLRLRDDRAHAQASVAESRPTTPARDDSGTSDSCRLCSRSGRRVPRAGDVVALADVPALGQHDARDRSDVALVDHADPRVAGIDVEAVSSPIDGIVGLGDVLEQRVRTRIAWSSPDCSRWRSHRPCALTNRAGESASALMIELRTSKATPAAAASAIALQCHCTASRCGLDSTSTLATPDIATWSDRGDARSPTTASHPAGGDSRRSRSRSRTNTRSVSPPAARNSTSAEPSLL
jgi:hypothetical protein